MVESVRWAIVSMAGAGVVVSSWPFGPACCQECNEEEATRVVEAERFGIFYQWLVCQGCSEEFEERWNVSSRIGGKAA